MKTTFKENLKCAFEAFLIVMLLFLLDTLAGKNPLVKAEVVSAATVDADYNEVDSEPQQVIFGDVFYGDSLTPKYNFNVPTYGTVTLSEWSNVNQLKVWRISGTDTELVKTYTIDKNNDGVFASLALEPGRYFLQPILDDPEWDFEQYWWGTFKLDFEPKLKAEKSDMKADTLPESQSEQNGRFDDEYDCYLDDVVIEPTLKLKKLSSTSVKLYWDDCDADGYEIYQVTSSGYKLIKRTSNLSCKIKLSAKKSYRFVARAYYDLGDEDGYEFSIYSNRVTKKAAR